MFINILEVFFSKPAVRCRTKPQPEMFFCVEDWIGLKLQSEGGLTINSAGHIFEYPGERLHVQKDEKKKECQSLVMLL